MLSYNELIKINKQFADNHYVIKNFGNGERWQIVDHQQTASFKYPLMFIEDLPSNTGEKLFSYAFRIWFVTRVEAPSERGTELLYAEFAKGKSDMIACAKDFIAFWVQDTNYPELELNRSVNIETFIDKDPDNFTGCYMDVRFDVVMNYDNCIIPMDGVPSPDPDDVVITINGATWETYLAGTTNDIVVKDTDGTAVGSKIGSEWIVPAAGGDPVANTMNGVSLTDAVAGTTKNFTIRYEDDSAVTVTTITDNATTFIGEVPNVLNTSNLIKTGAVSENSNDDGDTNFGRLTDRLTLDYNNGFGNTNRFTDTSGGQTYSNDLVVDWSQWNQINDTVLVYKRTLQSAIINNIWVNFPETYDSKSDWYMANILELAWIFNLGVTTQMLNYAPFNISNANTTNLSIVSSTPSGSITTYKAYGGSTNWFNRTTLLESRYMIRRIYTLTELGI